MATREKVYCKFGMAAEAAQLFETELGTLLLGINGLENEWHINPDPETGRLVMDKIEANTLGRLLGQLKEKCAIDDNIVDRFGKALKARNRLMHGFYEKHNFRMQSDEGRDLMLADLEQLHDELSTVWQMAGAMTATFMKLLLKAKAPDDTNKSVDE